MSSKIRPIKCEMIGCMGHASHAQLNRKVCSSHLASLKHGSYETLEEIARKFAVRQKEEERQKEEQRKKQEEQKKKAS